VKTLQAPLRSGVIVEEYQLEPVARAIEAPRVNLLQTIMIRFARCRSSSSSATRPASIVLPRPTSSASTARIERRRVVGGLISEYHRAA
jgi:hypothetical protein